MYDKEINANINSDQHNLARAY